MEKEKIDNRRVYSFEKFMELITSPIDNIKRKLVLAGHNLLELNSKTNTELMQMILNYVTIDKEEFINMTSSKNLSDLTKIQSLSSLIGLPKKELYKKIFNTDIEEVFSVNEVDQYLYNTEELFNNVIMEFLNSNLPSIDRVINYINGINEVEKQFRNYSVKTNGFVGSDRYKEVIEYLKKIPRVPLYKNDDTKGDGINFVNSKRYYEDMLKILEEKFNEIKSAKVL